MHKIEQIYLFVAVETADGDEGVCGYMTPDGWMPMVASDEKRLDRLRPLAEEIAMQTGKTIKLIKFEKRTELETIYGNH